MNILAAFIFFTRLPFWKIKEVPAECFKHVVPYWPLAGWLTGGIMAGTLWLTGQILPLSIAWVMAVIARLLVTGCLHEDGLADFLDGFGGATTRERTLAIMKDSHIGSYGVIGLIIYFLLLSQLSFLPLHLLCILVFCGDCWSKFCASQLINYLPYARKEEDQSDIQPYELARTSHCIHMRTITADSASARKAMGRHFVSAIDLCLALPTDETPPARIYGGLLRSGFFAL